MVDSCYSAKEKGRRIRMLHFGRLWIVNSICLTAPRNEVGECDFV